MINHLNFNLNSTYRNEIKKDLNFLYCLVIIGTIILLFNGLVKYEIMEFETQQIDNFNLFGVISIVGVFTYWIYTINIYWYTKILLLIRCYMFIYIFLYTYTDIIHNLNQHPIFLFKPINFEFIINNDELNENFNDDGNIINNVFNNDIINDEFDEYKELIQKQMNEQLVLSCKFAYVDNIKELIKLGADIHYANELPLITAYKHNKIDVVNYLYSITDKFNIYAQNNSIFKYVCKNNDIQLILDLLELDSKRDKKFTIQLDNITISKCYINDNNIENYYNKDYKKFLENSKLKKINDYNKYNEDCYMCLDEKEKIKYKVYLPCNHMMCLDCFINFYYLNISHDICGYCKKELELNDCSYYIEE